MPAADARIAEGFASRRRAEMSVRVEKMTCQAVFV